MYVEEKFHKIDERLQNKIRLHDQLYMPLWRGSSLQSLPMDAGSVSADSNFIMPNALPWKTTPTPYESILAELNELNFFLKSGSLTIYNVFSDFNTSAGSSLKNGKIIFLSRLVYRYLYSFETLLPKIYAKTAERSNMMISSASCPNLLKHGFFVQVFALLTIGRPKNFEFQALHCPWIIENLKLS